MGKDSGIAVAIDRENSEAIVKPRLRNAFKIGTIEAGCDEAGRGCLAGPVVAAAVILPEKFSHPLLNDSKQLTEKQRESLRTVIIDSSVAIGIGIVSPALIDEINILQASLLAMHLALDQLKIVPEHIIVDGNKFKAYKDISHQCIVKGDAKFKSIAAASVMAKTERDRLMLDLHDQFPQYRWNENKGYPTMVHRQAIREFGITDFHRRSFTLLPEQLKLF